MSNISLRSWLASFEAGLFNSKDTQTQIEAGWYDWFCRDHSLRGKTYALAPKVKRIAKSSKVNVDTMYVFFKNNCPMVGSLYDDFRICDMETGEVVYTIVPKTGHRVKFGQTEIWGRENNFDEALYEGDWNGALKWFGVSSSLLE